jgi:quinol-cytochrome oxidoreductase complex cytochrome b subunit
MTEPIPAPEAPPPDVPRHRWYHVAMALIFIVFCLELGMFLVIFPWSDLWERSFFSSLAPEWRMYWDNAYLRGAVSGLGIVNVYISLTEIFRLRRFARR